MEKYTIFCTEEQTRRALNLGAPIDKTHANPSMSFVDRHPKLFWVSTDDNKIDVGYVLAVPTAEQMLGWLRSKELYAHTCREDGGLFSYCVLTEKSQGTYDIEKESYYFSTYKEATLAAINAALDYLIRSKEG